MRVIVLGSQGQLGQALLNHAPKGVDVLGLSRSEFDLTAMDVEKLSGADAIINTAAYTAVDAAETDVTAAEQLNTIAPGELAQVASDVGAHFIHVSTDYVFGAQAPRRPLLVDDPKHPNTVYGKTKLEGEHRVLEACPDAAIVRTAWLFSGDTQPHADFVSTMLRLARGDGPVRVVNDQWGNPTFVPDLAAGLWTIAQERIGGVLHGVGQGAATWFELAQETFTATGADVARVQPCTTADFPRPAPRPAWSVLDTSSWEAAGLVLLPEWQCGVLRAVSDRL